MPEAAKLPAYLRSEPTRSKISDMQPGDIWWIIFTSMEVDHDNGCFLDPSAERQMPGGLNRIIVRRDTDGYHVTIPDTYRFAPYQTRGWIPVTSIEDHIPDEEIFDEIARAAQRRDRNEISRLMNILLGRDG